MAGDWRALAKRIKVRWLKANFTRAARARLQQSGAALTRLGSGYGGWWVDASRLIPGSAAICVGIGEDTSFDEALASIYGLKIFGVDPTPRAIAHVQKIVFDSGNSDLASHYTLEPSALWSKSGSLRLYFPKDETHVSLSVIDNGRRNSLDVPTVTLREIFVKHGISKCSVLKLDIEGAELDVLNGIELRDLDIEQICVEFDAIPIKADRSTLVRTLSILDCLKANDFRVAAVDGWNVLLLKEPRRGSAT